MNPTAPIVCTLATLIATTLTEWVAGWWPVALAFIGAVWWAAKIEGRVKRSEETLATAVEKLEKIDATLTRMLAVQEYLAGKGERPEA